LINGDPDKLIIKAKNVSIELRPRTIVVENAVDYREGVDKKRYIYIYFREMFEPFENKVVEQDYSREHVNYEVRHVKTYFGEYLTMITPPQFFIDYLILSSDELAVVLSGKREVYYEKIGDVLTIYIV